MTNFLPTDYKQPDNKDYMKFKDGENTFRVLSSAIVGFEYWTTENKPVRSAVPFKDVPDDIKKDKDGNFTIKHFWAFLVYNQEAKRVQVLEVTQSSVQAGIKALVDNKNWGDPKGYDITVTRVGSGLDTEYAVMPNPQSMLQLAETDDQKIQSAKLNNLFESKPVWEK